MKRYLLSALTLFLALAAARAQECRIIATADAPGHDDVIPFPFSVDTEPSFNGGTPNAFAAWVNQQLVYPEESRRMGYEGTVYLSFTVYADGTVHDVEVMDSAGDDRLDAEAVRVVSRSPRWTPATIDKKPVKYRFRFPVIFALKAR